MWKPPEQLALSRAELYDLVWSEAVTQIAPRYGISDVGFAKLCRRAEVPLPPRGYWAKTRNGKKVRRPVLKPRKDGGGETVVITKGTRGAPRPSIPDDVAVAIAAEGDPENVITVPGTVTHWHPIVAAWGDEEKRLSLRWPGQALKSRPDALERRRRRLLNGFSRALERRGWGVAVRERGGFAVTLLGVTVDLTCFEWVRQYRAPVTREERKRLYLLDRDYKIVHEPTGLLRLRLIQNISGYRDWTETAEQPLENRLNDVIIGMLREVVRKRAREAKWAEEARIQAETRQREIDAAQRRRSAEEARRLEQQRVDVLLDEVVRWRRAADLREYIAIARSARLAAGDPDADAWSVWALDVATAIDPLCRGGSNVPTPS